MGWWQEFKDTIKFGPRDQKTGQRKGGGFCDRRITPNEHAMDCSREALAEANKPTAAGDAAGIAINKAKAAASATVGAASSVIDKAKAAASATVDAATTAIEKAKAPEPEPAVASPVSIPTPAPSTPLPTIKAEEAPKVEAPKQPETTWNSRFDKSTYERAMAKIGKTEARTELAENARTDTGPAAPVSDKPVADYKEIAARIKEDPSAVKQQTAPPTPVSSVEERQQTIAANGPTAQELAGLGA